MFPKKANILKPLLEWISQRALCLLADVLGWLERCWESSPSRHLTKLNWTDCKSSVLQMEMAQEILCEKEEGIFVLLIVILYNELLSSKCLYRHFLFLLIYTSPQGLVHKCYCSKPKAFTSVGDKPNLTWGCFVCYMAKE